MKHRVLVLALSSMLATLVGCSSVPNNTASNNFNTGAGITPDANSRTAIADQRLAVSDFKKEGVKVIYDLKGQLG